jgi:hypothetical protein
MKSHNEIEVNQCCFDCVINSTCKNTCKIFSEKIFRFQRCSKDFKCNNTCIEFKNKHGGNIYEKEK